MGLNIFGIFLLGLRYGEKRIKWVCSLSWELPQYLEMGRVEWLRSMGHFYKTMEERE